MADGGEDEFADELCAAGSEEEEFSLRIHVFAGVGVFEDVADAFADFSTTGFAGDDGGFVSILKAFSEAADLSGFTAAFGAFKGDKDTTSSLRGRSYFFCGLFSGSFLCSFFGYFFSGFFRFGHGRYSHKKEEVFPDKMLNGGGPLSI